MYLVTRELLPRFNLGSDAATYQLKLPNAGHCSALSILMEWVNGGTSNKDQDVYDAIDKIEIISGGNVTLYSLTGHQARLWSHVFLGQRPPYRRDESPDVTQTAWIHIPFGLFKGDMNHFMPFARFRNLELRITYSPTIGATGFLTGNGYITVYADMFEMGDPGPFNGLLRVREHYYFTSAASGNEYYELPNSDVLMALGLYVYEAGIAPEVNIPDFKVDLNNEQHVVIDSDFEVLQQKFTAELGIDPTEWGIVYKSDTDVIETRVGTLEVVNLEKVQDLTIGTTDETHNVVASVAAGQVTLDVLSRDAAVTADDAANTTDAALKWVAKPRYGLGNFLVVPFGLQRGMQYGLPLANFGRVRVTMGNGNAGAEVRLSTAEIFAP